MGGHSGWARTWRVSPVSRLLQGTFITGLLGSLIVEEFFADSPSFGLAAFVAAMIAGFLWILVIRPRVVVTATDVRIVNPLRTRIVQRNQIVAIEPVFAGLAFRLATGRTATAFAIQENNYLLIMGKRQYSDRVAEEIRRTLDLPEIRAR